MTNIIGSDALPCRYQADMMFQKNRLYGISTSNTVDIQAKYLDMNIYAKDLLNGTLFFEMYTMVRKAYYEIALESFITVLVVPEQLTNFINK